MKTSVTYKAPSDPHSNNTQSCSPKSPVNLIMFDLREINQDISRASVDLCNYWWPQTCCGTHPALPNGLLNPSVVCICMCVCVRVFCIIFFCLNWETKKGSDFMDNMLSMSVVSVKHFIFMFRFFIEMLKKKDGWQLLLSWCHKVCHNTNGNTVRNSEIVSGNVNLDEVKVVLNSEKQQLTKALLNVSS